MKLGTGPVPVSAAVTGLEKLDTLLYGLHWGENLLWRLPAGEAGDRVATALGAAAHEVPGYETFRRVDVDDDAHVAELLSLGPAAPAEHWAVDLRGAAGVDDAERASRIARLIKHAFTRRVVAYWFLDSERALPAWVPLVQCVLHVSRDAIRVERAEGHPSRVQGIMLPYSLSGGGELLVESGSTASLLGRGLRTIRQARGWSQAELGSLIGVSAAAISQTERGQHALSLESLLELSERVGVTIDELIYGRPAGYELLRGSLAGDPAGNALSRHYRGDHGHPVESTALSLPVGGSVSLMPVNGRHRLLLVARGIVQLSLDDERPLLREGDTFAIADGAVRSCRNVGEGEARVFWIALGG